MSKTEIITEFRKEVGKLQLGAFWRIFLLCMLTSIISVLMEATNPMLPTLLGVMNVVYVSMVYTLPKTKELQKKYYALLKTQHEKELREGIAKDGKMEPKP